MGIRIIWLFIRGKLVRSLLYMFLISFVDYSVFLVATFYFVHGYIQSEGVFYYCVRVYPRNADAGISEDTLEKLLESPFIEGYNSVEIYHAASLVFGNQGSDNKETGGYKEGEGETAELTACIDPIYSDIFMHGAASLIEGQFPSGTLYGAVMEKEMADSHGLGIGDSIQMEVEIQGQPRKIELPVVGIYASIPPNGMNGTVYGFSPPAGLFTSFASIGRGFNGTPLEYIDLLVKKEAQLDGVEDFIRLVADGEVYALRATDFTFMVLNRSVEKTSKYIGWMLNAFMFSSTLLLILFTIYVQRGNLYETAIMICVGKPKRTILFLALGQTLIQVVVAVGAVLGGMISTCGGIVSYWVALFTQSYREGSLDYHFGFTYGAIVQRIDLTKIIREMIVLGGFLILLPLFVVILCVFSFLRQKAMDIVLKSL